LNVFEAGLLLLDLDTCLGLGSPVRGVIDEEGIPPLARICSEVMADRDRGSDEDEEEEDDLALALASAFWRSRSPS
jgi:hypothetical protein